jgi:hypothetical protein
VADALRSQSLEQLFYSPALAIAFVEMAVVAPLVEELTKPLGALLLGKRLRTPAEAFLVGMAGGAGFAIVENMLYEAAGARLWAHIATLRAIGGVLHPLTAGLVAVGWYGVRRGQPGAWRRWLALYGLAVGVHALWNGGLTVLVSRIGSYFLGADTWSFSIYGIGQPGVMVVFIVLEAIALWRLLWVVSGRLRDSAAPSPETGLALHLERPRRLALWAVALLLVLVPVGALYGPLLARNGGQLSPVAMAAEPVTPTAAPTASPSPTPTAAPATTQPPRATPLVSPAATSVAAQPLPGGSVAGTVLLSDTADDPAVGVLPKAASQPEAQAMGYSGGEYFIRVLDSGQGMGGVVFVPGTYQNAAIAVDARPAPDTPGALTELTCRRTFEPGTGPNTPPPNGYVARIDTHGGRFRIARMDGGTATSLAGWQVSAAIRRGTAANRIELACVGNSISLTVNGARVATVEDGTYPAAGRVGLGTNFFTGASGPMEVRYDNLVVTQQ